MGHWEKGRTEYARFEHEVVEDGRVEVFIDVNQFDQQRADRAERRLAVVRYL